MAPRPARRPQAASRADRDLSRAAFSSRAIFAAAVALESCRVVAARIMVEGGRGGPFSLESLSWRGVPCSLGSLSWRGGAGGTKAPAAPPPPVEAMVAEGRRS